MKKDRWRMQMDDGKRAVKREREREVK